MRYLLVISSILAVLLGTVADAFVQPSVHSFKLAQTISETRLKKSISLSLSSENDNSGKKKKDIVLSIDELKVELTAYLEFRGQFDADAAAQAQVGKVVGGTKGNPILEYVSGSPNKEIIIDEAPNVLDYDELERYGYGNLVTSIMKNGGRNAMYDLMGLERPPPPNRLQPKPVPKLVIDRTGETDEARYKGLKMGQVMDDDAMAEALAAAQRKRKAGESLRTKIAEEDYVQPFADKRNVSPKMTPAWTAERLDEYGKARGKAEAWARRAKMGEFVGDPFETLNLPLSFQIYSIFSAFLVAFAFGRSTPNLLERFDIPPGSADILQGPALAILVASLGSAVISGAVLAPSKNRGTFIWAMKGLLAGPAAVLQLRGLADLITQGEEEEQGRQ